MLARAAGSCAYAARRELLAEVGGRRAQAKQKLEGHLDQVEIQDDEGQKESGCDG
jgi:hypothetical protein